MSDHDNGKGDHSDKLTILLSSDTRDIRAAVKGDASDGDSVEVTLSRKGDASVSRGRWRTLFWMLSAVAVLVAILFALFHRSKGDQEEGR